MIASDRSIVRLTQLLEAHIARYHADTSLTETSPWISPDVQAVTVDEVAHAAAGVLSSLGHRRAHFVGHSYGTFVISRVRQLYPEVNSHRDCAAHPPVALSAPPSTLQCLPPPPAQYLWQ